MRVLFAFSFFAVVAGCDPSAPPGDGGTTPGVDGGGRDGGTTVLPDVGPPVARCDAPALADVSAPDHVVGDGTAASCTEAALRAAAGDGGTITFDCGDAPVTITVTSQIVFTEETVIDGEGSVTLSGGGTSRIFYLDSGYDTPTPRLTVQRLAFEDGRSADTGDDTADGGAAIYRDGGSLTVVDCSFTGNHAPATGQDLAGGAIYAFGGGDTIIAGSSFTENSASDGGAVGSLNGDLTLINSTFVGNAATGSGGNPGDGGCGGAIYQDGRDELTNFCGVTISNNTAGAIGGGVFRVSNEDNGTLVMDRTTVDGNRVTPTTEGNAGGLYLQGLALSISASTISRNSAFYCGGLWLNESAVDIVNTTIAENVATGSNGGGIWLGNAPTGTIRFSTIARNRNLADGQVAGAIFGGGLTLVGTLIVENTSMYRPQCEAPHESGGGNLQFPFSDSAACTESPATGDPMLGVLGDNGGDTETMLPASGSPAIDLGTSCPPTDQRGMPRGDPCTAGAVEVP